MPIGVTMIHVTDARYVRDYVVWVRFTDGIEGEVDLARELDGPVFEPLRDPSLFGLVRLDPELHTIVWPNGADVAPEFLHSRVRAVPDRGRRGHLRDTP